MRGRQLDYAITQAIAKHIVAVFPVFQPVGAEYLVLIEQVGHLHGKPILATPVSTLSEQRAQRSKSRFIEVLRQQSQQTPNKARLVERRRARYIGLAQHGAVGLPQETPRQLHIHRGTDS